MTFQFKPNRCVIELTYSCNLRCATCIVWTADYASSRMRTQPCLNMQELKTVQCSLARCGIKRITYLGGEPFLRKELLPLAAHARSRGISAAVVTNGTCVSRATARNVVDKQPFDIVIFSLDGPPAVHDRIRGIPGTFQRAAAAIRDIQKFKKTAKAKFPRIFIYVTVSSINTPSLESMLDTARELDAQAIRFISASCLDSALIKKTNALFTVPAIRRHSYAVGPQLAIPVSQLPSLRRRFARMEVYARTIGMRFLLEGFLRNGKAAPACAVLGKELVISASGNVYPCPMLPEYTIGNVRTHSLESILSASGTEQKTRRLFELSAAGKLPVCRQCCVEKIARSS
jgi:radical SAM protein with 4Fe4S-binding SPASM domain